MLYSLYNIGHFENINILIRYTKSIFSKKNIKLIFHYLIFVTQSNI